SVLIHGHRDAAQRLSGGHRPVQPRAVVADDREVRAALESLRRKPAGERADLGCDLRPSPGLPDAEILLAGRGTIAARGRVLQHQPRKSQCVLVASAHDRHSSHAATSGWRSYCALIPAALITLAESVISVSTNCLNSGGVSGMGSAPSVAKRSFTSGDCAAARTSRAILSTTSGGVPAGANMPTQSE